MQFQTENHDGVVVLQPQGEIDIANVNVLKEFLQQISADETMRIVIDLSKVSFIDSSVLGALVSFFKTVSGYGGRIRLSNLRPVIARTFSLTKLDDVFEIFDQLQAAIDGEWGD